MVFLLFFFFGGETKRVLSASVCVKGKIAGFQAAEAEPVVLANLSGGLVALAACKFFMRLRPGGLHCNCNGSLALKTHIKKKKSKVLSLSPSSEVRLIFHFTLYDSISSVAGAETCQRPLAKIFKVLYLYQPLSSQQQCSVASVISLFQVLRNQVQDCVGFRSPVSFL